MNRLAVQIKEARLKSKLTEKELAQKAGVQLSYLLQIESGKKVVNEQVAQKILDVLGQEMKFISDLDQPVETPLKKTVVAAKSAQATAQPVAPTSQWTDVLSGVIKKYSIIVEGTEKVSGYREHVITSKKVDGIHFEKLFYLEIAHDDLNQMRIKKGDVAQFQEINAIENNCIYYFSHKNIKQIRLLRIENGHTVLALKHLNDKSPEVYELSALNVIGKLNKIEFFL